MSLVKPDLKVSILKNYKLTGHCLSWAKDERRVAVLSEQRIEEIKPKSFAEFPVACHRGYCEPLA